MKKFVLIAAMLPLIASAQMKPNGEWQFPDSVRTLCVNTEQGMVAMFRQMIETNRKTVKLDVGPEIQSLMAQAEELKRSLRGDEETWYRLGCASILYGTEKKR